jgi:hypothetical protein
MRFVFCTLSFFLGALQTTIGEETISKTVSPQSQVTVLCRKIDDRGIYQIFPKQTLSDERKGLFADIAQSPFVVGVTPIKGKYAEAMQPNIVILDEGMNIEVTIRGRLDHGASVEIAIEQSKIGEVETKEIIPGKTAIQIPHVELHKKRVFDFLKYGEVLAISLDGKDKGPRIELVLVSDGMKDPPGWISPKDAPKDSSLGTSMMGMVPPSLRIQEEEEEKLGISEAP